MYLSPDLLLCDRHGALMKEHWPRGWAFLSSKLYCGFMCLLHSQKIIGDDPKNIPIVLARQSACCRISSDVLLDLFMATHINDGVWTMGQCTICSCDGVGGHLPSYTIWGQLCEVYGHVCLKCLVYSAQTHHRVFPSIGDYHGQIEVQWGANQATESALTARTA